MAWDFPKKLTIKRTWKCKPFTITYCISLTFCLYLISNTCWSFWNMNFVLSEEGGYCVFEDLPIFMKSWDTPLTPKTLKNVQSGEKISWDVINKMYTSAASRDMIAELSCRLHKLWSLRRLTGAMYRPIRK